MQVNNDQTSVNRDQNALQKSVNTGQSGGDIIVDIIESVVGSTGLPKGRNGSDLGLTSFVTSRRCQRVRCEHVRGTGSGSRSGAIGSGGPRENTQTLGFIKRQNDAI